MQNSPKWLLEEYQAQLDRNRLIVLINSMNEGFLATDENGLIRLCNSAALNILDANRLLGKTLSQAMPLSDAAGSQVDIAGLINTGNGKLITDKYSVKHSDGVATPLHISVSPVRGSNSKIDGLVVVLRENSTLPS